MTAMIMTMMIIMTMMMMMLEAVKYYKQSKKFLTMKTQESFCHSS